MIYKTYGANGIEVSAVGFGGMRFDTSLPKEQNAELLSYALEKGITYFDTAPGYCADQSEDIFGIAMKQLASRRDSFYVSTKGMPTEFDTADKARAAVEKSLRRLNLDCIDFYHVWCIRKVEHYQLAMKQGGQYEGLLRCQDEGLIKHIVISTHLPGDKIQMIMHKGEFEGVLLGVNILNFPYRWQGVQASHEMGYGVVAMNPLAGGLIPQNESQLGFLTQSGETPTEAALRFCISCPQITVTLVGFTAREHIDAACRIADAAKPFSAEEIDRLKDNLSENMNAICTGCGYCVRDCPVKIPVAAFMQWYNEKQMFHKTDDQMISDLPNQRFWGILAERQADASDCIACKRCEQACTQNLNIVSRLAEIAYWEKAIDSQKK